MRDNCQIDKNIHSAINSRASWPTGTLWCELGKMSPSWVREFSAMLMVATISITRSMYPNPSIFKFWLRVLTSEIQRTRSLPGNQPAWQSRKWKTGSQSRIVSTCFLTSSFRTRCFTCNYWTTATTGLFFKVSYTFRILAQLKTLQSKKMSLFRATVWCNWKHSNGRTVEN